MHILYELDRPLSRPAGNAEMATGTGTDLKRALELTRLFISASQVSSELLRR